MYDILQGVWSLTVEAARAATREKLAPRPRNLRGAWPHQGVTVVWWRVRWQELSSWGMLGIVGSVKKEIIPALTPNNGEPGETHLGRGGITNWVESLVTLRARKAT